MDTAIQALVIAISKNFIEGLISEDEMNKQMDEIMLLESSDSKETTGGFQNLDV